MRPKTGESNEAFAERLYEAVMATQVQEGGVPPQVAKSEKPRSLGHEGDDETDDDGHRGGVEEGGEGEHEDADRDESEDNDDEA